MSIFTNGPDSGPNAVTRIAKFLRKRIWLTVVILLVSLGAFGAGLKYLEDDARQQKALKPKDRSLLSKVNPFLALPTPTPTPQLSKEFIYAGSRLLAVEDVNANAAPPADLAVWRPSNGNWYVMGGTGSQQVTWGWGLNGDKPVPGDYDGDGKTDFSVFRPSESKWYIMFSSDGTYSTLEWGISGDIAAPADYDGDGKTDRAVFRQNDPSSGNAKWYIYRSADGTTFSPQWGLTGDKPAPADYDGDGRADLTVWRASNSNFYSVYSSNSSQNTIDFANGGAQVSADYDGDGKADFAVFDESASPYAKWYVRSSISGSMMSDVSWGLAGDIAVPNDYDGDGLCDIAVWRPTNSSGHSDAGHWFIRQSASSNSMREVGWGLSGDVPVPAYFRR